MKTPNNIWGMAKVNNKDNITTSFVQFCGVSIVDFEQVCAG